MLAVHSGRTRVDCLVFASIFEGGHKTLHSRKYPINNKGSSFEGCMSEEGLEGIFYHVEWESYPSLPSYIEKSFYGTVDQGMP